MRLDSKVYSGSKHTNNINNRNFTVQSKNTHNVLKKDYKTELKTDHRHTLEKKKRRKKLKKRRSRTSREKTPLHSDHFVPPLFKISVVATTTSASSNFIHF